MTRLKDWWRSVPRIQRLGDTFIVGLTFATQLEIWQSDLDHKLALACLHAAGPHAVTPASGGGRALVVCPPQERAHFLFDGALDDQLSAEAA